MTQDAFIAIAGRVSFGGGLLLWGAALRALPISGGGVRLQVVKMVPRRELVELDASSPEKLSAQMGWIGADDFVGREQLDDFEKEAAAAEYILEFVRESMLHEIEESIRFDGEIVLDPHAEDEKEKAA